MQPVLPSEHRALVLESRESGLQPNPRVTTTRPWKRSYPSRCSRNSTIPHRGLQRQASQQILIGGFGAIGHMAAVGAYAAALKPGQLDYVDCVIRARDDPDSLFLSAIYQVSSDDSRKLMGDVWGDGTFVC